MTRRSIQAPDAVRSARDTFIRIRRRPSTTRSKFDPSGSHADIAGRACGELTVAAEALQRAGVRVHLFDEPGSDRPDNRPDVPVMLWATSLVGSAHRWNNTELL